MTDIYALLRPLQGSRLIPSFEHARVRDAMHPGVITCLPDTPMEAVARIMATHRVHAVVVAGPDDPEWWAVITDRDLVAVASTAAERHAGSCATQSLLTASPHDSLRFAAEVMLRHDVSHLIVVDPGRHAPVGVISTLDIAHTVAWGRG